MTSYYPKPVLYTVFLASIGPVPIETIRLVREFRRDLKPAEAKAFVLNTPQLLLRDVTPQTWGWMQPVFASVGAVVEAKLQD